MFFKHFSIEHHLLFTHTATLGECQLPGSRNSSFMHCKAFRYLYAEKKMYYGEEFVTLFAYNDDRNRYPLASNVIYTLEAKNSQDR